jgi:hypothetical protein
MTRQSESQFVRWILADGIGIATMTCQVSLMEQLERRDLVLRALKSMVS